MEVELAFRTRHVSVVRARQIVVIGRPQECEPVRRCTSSTPLRENETALFGPRRRKLKEELLLAQATRPRHVEVLGDLVSAVTLSSLSDDRSRLAGRPVVYAGLTFSSISVHSLFIPSPVTAETATKK